MQGRYFRMQGNNTGKQGRVHWAGSGKWWHPQNKTEAVTMLAERPTIFCLGFVTTACMLCVFFALLKIDKHPVLTMRDYSLIVVAASFFSTDGFLCTPPIPNLHSLLKV